MVDCYLDGEYIINIPDIPNVTKLLQTDYDEYLLKILCCYSVRNISGWFSQIKDELLGLQL